MKKTTRVEQAAAVTNGVQGVTTPVTGVTDRASSLLGTQVCSVCAHKDVAAIDDGLRRGLSLRQLERRFGVGRASVSRHSKHTRIVDEEPVVLPPSPVPAVLPPVELRQAGVSAQLEPTAPPVTGSAVDQLRAVIDDMRRLVRKAEKNGHLQVASGTLKNIASAIETLARLSGELEQPPTAIFNFQLIDSFVRKHEARLTAALEAKEPAK